MFMMVGCVQEELNALKQGLNDVIPNELLSGLTAEVSSFTNLLTILHNERQCADYFPSHCQLLLSGGY